MTLLTDEQKRQLLAHGAESAAGKDIDPMPVVKLFTPYANATWLLTELDPADENTAFGLCDLGLGCPELGYITLKELETGQNLLGLHVERDLGFAADKPLSAYAEAARLAARIVA